MCQSAHFTTRANVMFEMDERQILYVVRVRSFSIFGRGNQFICAFKIWLIYGSTLIHKIVVPTTEFLLFHLVYEPAGGPIFLF